MSSCKLRPHHALCIGFFRGKGYSEDFIENMTAFIGSLRATDPLLTLRSAADPLCGSCPNNRGGVCDSAGKVARYDAAVLRLLELSDGAALRWSELSARVRERILAPGRLDHICGDCQWYDICSQAAVE